jgi:hypothetical protein
MVIFVDRDQGGGCLEQGEIELNMYITSNRR